MKWINGIGILLITTSLSGCYTVTTTTSTTVPTADYVYYTGAYGYRPYTTTWGFSYGPSYGYTTRSIYGYSFGH